MSDELVLRPSEGKIRKKRKPMTVEDRLKSPTLSMRLLGKFMVGYAKAWGHPYPVQFFEVKDLSILKKMGEAWGEDVVTSLIVDFFLAARPVEKGGDPVVSKVRSSHVSDFMYHSQYLMLKRSRGSPLQEKTASNVHEVTKAMGRKK